MPTSVEHAKESDKRNGNRFWQDALDKEMLNVGVSFQTFENDEALPVG